MIAHPTTGMAAAHPRTARVNTLIRHTSLSYRAVGVQGALRLAFDIRVPKKAG